jgi:hypothetical protein
MRKAMNILKNQRVIGSSGRRFGGKACRFGKNCRARR